MKKYTFKYLQLHLILVLLIIVNNPKHVFRIIVNNPKQVFRIIVNNPKHVFRIIVNNPKQVLINAKIDNIWHGDECKGIAFKFFSIIMCSYVL